VSQHLSHDHYTRRILAEVEAGNVQSQRSLARTAGIALGLTNLLLRRTIRKGWVRMIHVKPNRVRYLITPSGIAEKARMSTAYFAYTTRFYKEARDRVRERFATLSNDWPTKVSGGGVKRIAFYGRGEVAEIGYICLQETDLIVTAVFDGEGGNGFFGAPVHRVTALDEPAAWTRFDVLAVVMFDEAARKQAELHLQRIQFPCDRLFWI
jgi:hypothetical protein